MLQEEFVFYRWMARCGHWIRHNVRYAASGASSRKAQADESASALRLTPGGVDDTDTAKTAPSGTFAESAVAETEALLQPSQTVFYGISKPSS